VNQGGGGRNNQYGPPQQYQQPEPQQSRSQYGPPGYTPGQPLGFSQPQQCPPNDPQANKALAKRMYQELFGDHNLANIESYYHQDYIQHNPMVPDGLDKFKEALMGPLGAGPQMQIDFKRASAEDDLVWIHTRLPLLGKIFAVVDIFRFECGKIREHWDVLQDTNLMMPSANPHPFF